jgi:hypothetical protein
MMHIHIHIHARKGTGIADPGTALAGSGPADRELGDATGYGRKLYVVLMYSEVSEPWQHNGLVTEVLSEGCREDGGVRNTVGF